MLTSEQKNDRPCEKSLSCEKIDNEKKDLSHQCPIEVQNLASIIFSIMFTSFEITDTMDDLSIRLLNLMCWSEIKEER